MEMSEKYIMQSSKWHAAEQKGNVYVVEQLGTIQCLRNINGELTVSGQGSTPQSTCGCHQWCGCSREKWVQVTPWDSRPPTWAHLHESTQVLAARPQRGDEAFASSRAHMGQAVVPRHRTLPVALILSLALPVSPFFQSLWHLDWCGHFLVSVSGVVHPLLPTNAICNICCCPNLWNPPRQKILATGKCVGCLQCRIYLSRIVYKDLWGISYI